MNSKQRRAVYDYDGPLGTFSAKIAVAYAMSAIGPIFRNDLDLIRILRNGFAHSKKSIKFDDAETAAVCAKLKTPDMSDVRIAVQSFKTATEPDWDKYSDLTKTSEQISCRRADNFGKDADSTPTIRNGDCSCDATFAASLTKIGGANDRSIHKDRFTLRQFLGHRSEEIAGLFRLP